MDLIWHLMNQLWMSPQNSSSWNTYFLLDETCMNEGLQFFFSDTKQNIFFKKEFIWYDEWMTYEWVLVRKQIVFFNFAIKRSWWNTYDIFDKISNFQQFKFFSSETMPNYTEKKIRHMMNDIWMSPRNYTWWIKYEFLTSGWNMYELQM